MRLYKVELEEGNMFKNLGANVCSLMKIEVSHRLNEKGKGGGRSGEKREKYECRESDGF